MGSKCELLPNHARSVQREQGKKLRPSGVACLLRPVSANCHQPSVADLHARQDRQDALHAQAWELARMQFGGRAFVRGVVEVSNFCREDTVVSALTDAGLSPSRTSLAEHWESQTVLEDLAASR